MSYNLPPTKETSGCHKTLVKTSIIGQILAVPLALIFGALIGLLVAVYAFSEHVLLGFAVIAIAVISLTALARWEYIRVKRDLPPPDDFEPIDPRRR